MIYLDSAASSHPKPAPVKAAVLAQLRNGANPGRSGHPPALEASKTVFGTRQQLAEIFNTTPEFVIFTLNTTHAINLALKGLLRRGDHVLISDLEHNSVLRPLVALRERGVQFTQVPTSGDDETTLRAFRDRLRSDTKMIFCTHASNVTGQILPVRALGQMCREKGILFGVDGAQTAGTEALDLKKDEIDLLCIPGHKGLLGPQGTGALLTACPLDLAPLTEGGTGSHSLAEEQPRIFPEGYESGTVNTSGIAGLRAGAAYAEAHRKAFRAREAELRMFFTEELKKIPGYRILGQGEAFVPTVALVHETIPSERLAALLAEQNVCVRGGFHCALSAHRALGTTASGALRVSFGYRNTLRDVTECVKYLKNYQTNRTRG